MGELADAMIEGEMCEGCGVVMDNAQGFPQRCSSCK